MQFITHYGFFHFIGASQRVHPSKRCKKDFRELKDLQRIQLDGRSILIVIHTCIRNTGAYLVQYKVYWGVVYQ